ISLPRFYVAFVIICPQAILLVSFKVSSSFCIAGIGKIGPCPFTQVFMHGANGLFFTIVKVKSPGAFFFAGYVCTCLFYLIGCEPRFIRPIHFTVCKAYFIVFIATFKIIFPYALFKPA